MATERERLLQQEVQATLQRIHELERQLEHSEDEHRRADAQQALKVVFGGFRSKLQPGETIPSELRQLEERYGYPVDFSADFDATKES